MKGKDEKDKVQFMQTSLLFAAANLIALPIYIVSGNRLGLIELLAVNLGFMYHLHEHGKSRRLLDNATNKVSNFFGASNNIENSKDNFLEGGSSYFHEIAQMFQNRS